MWTTVSRKRAGDILPAPEIIIPPMAGYSLSEDDAARADVFKQKLIDKAIANEIEKKRMADVAKASADLLSASKAMKNMVNSLKSMPEKVAESAEQIALFREQYAEAVAPNKDGVVRNREPIDAKKFLVDLRLLKNCTDATIEMAPGVHTHTVDLIIEMIEGRR